MYTIIKEIMNHRTLRATVEVDEKAPVLVKTKFLYLSSQNRSSGDINNFNVNLPNDFFTKKKNQIIKLSLNNITITKTWYETRAGVSADYELDSVGLSLRDGSYAVDTLLAELNGLFTNKFIVSYDYPTNKFTFTDNTGTHTLKAVNCGYSLGLTDAAFYTPEHLYQPIQLIQLTKKLFMLIQICQEIML